MADPISIVALVLAAGSTVYAMTLDYDTGQDNDFGTLVNKAGTQSTRDVVYGRCLTGATVLYKNVKDYETDIRLDIFSCGIATSYIHQLLIDDVEVLASEGNYRETTDTNSLLFNSGQLQNGFEKQCVVQLRTGYALGAAMNGDLPVGVPMQLAMDNSDGEWTEKMRGDYTTMIAITSKRIVDDESIRIMGDQFKVNLEVSGVPVFDPRFGSDPKVKQYEHVGVPEENIQCGRNPALALLDYITNDYYGMSIKFEFIDIDSFIVAANYCDRRRFRVDGQLNQGNTFAQNINSIAVSAGLHPSIINGKLHCLFEDAGVASHHFNYNTLIKDTLKVKEQSSNEYINVVEVDYKNSDLLDEKDTFVLPVNLYPQATDPAYPSQIQKDGFLNQGNLELPMVRMSGDLINDADSQVRYFANRELQKQKFQKEITFDVDLDENNVGLFDIISITNEEYLWDKKEWRITAIRPRFNETEFNAATVTAREHSNDIYKGVDFGTPGSQKPIDKKEVKAPTDLNFTQYNSSKNNNGARLTWVRTFFESSSAFVVEYKKSSVPQWTHLGRTDATSWDFPLLPADVYDFRVATYSNLYGMSSFTELLNQEISSFGTLPTVKDATSIFTGQNCLFEWKNMSNEPVTLPANPDPSAPTNPTVKDYFSHYQVDIFHGNTFKKSYNTVSNNFIYTFDENKENGISRILRADIYIVADNGTKSQLGSSSSVTANNLQHRALSGFTQRGGELSSVTLQWELSTEPDYYSTSVRRKKGADGTYEYINVTGSFFADSLPSDDPVGTTYYYNVAARDVFDNNNINWSNEVVVKKTTIDNLLPEFHDELNDIRNPDYESQPNELVLNISNSTRTKIAGIGLYAPEDATQNSKFIVAADEFVISAGGDAEYDEERTYEVGERATISLTPEIQRLYEAKTQSTDKYPPDNLDDWELILDNTYQSAFYFNSITGKLILNSAVINEIDAGSITTGTLDADRIQANSITGEKIKSSTTIQVGEVIPDSEYEELIPDISMGTFELNVGKHTKEFVGDYFGAGRVNAIDYGLITNGVLEYYDDQSGNLFADDLFTIVNDTFNTGEQIIRRDNGNATAYKNRFSYLSLPTTWNDGEPYYPWDSLPDTVYMHIEETGEKFTFNKDEVFEYIYECENSIFLDNNLNGDYKIIISDRSDFNEIYKPLTEAVLIINGDDNISPNRLWSGNEDPELANTKIDKDGILTAKGAVIEGTIRANDGYFNGSVSGAEFNGAVINGTEVNGSLFKAGTIIASTIYASDTELLADPYGDGLPTYYQGASSIPVTVLPSISNSRSTRLQKGTNFQDAFLHTAFDNRGIPSTYSEVRAREATLPANSIRLDFSTGEVHTQLYNYFDAVEIPRPIVSIQSVDAQTNQVIDTVEVEANNSQNGAYSKDVTIGGLTFAVNSELSLKTFSISGGRFITHYQMKYLQVRNYQGVYGGDPSNPANQNVFFRISLRQAQPVIRVNADTTYDTLSDIYNYNVTASVVLQNE